MRKINKIIQLIFIGLIVILAAGMLYEVGIVMYILFGLLPLGFTQVVYGLIDVMRYRAESPFKYYLAIAIVTLIGIGLYGSYEHYLEYPYRDYPVYLLGGLSVSLALYFWYLTFGVVTTVKEHHVSDI